MKTSTDRFLTTHTGSLPRPAGFSVGPHATESDIREAVAEVVAAQVGAGIDILNDGEASKPSFASYVTERVSGFGGIGEGHPFPEESDFPEYVNRISGDAELMAALAPPACIGPIAYEAYESLRRDIENIRTATEGLEAEEVFMSAASPGTIALFMVNKYYATEEEYIEAIAAAMKGEYDAICQAGILLQLDCPDLTYGLNHVDHTDASAVARVKSNVEIRINALNTATRDIPPERMRLHVCWGNYEGPHHRDVPLNEILPLLLKARPAGLSFEGANPRHEHEWVVFKDNLPDDKVLIPGVIDSTTNYIEHPELVAQRIERYATLVGRERVIAGSDCGFSTFANYETVDPKITWAKLRAMAQGAEIASRRMY